MFYIIDGNRMRAVNISSIWSSSFFKAELCMNFRFGATVILD